jgi:hypothetical protein
MSIIMLFTLASNENDYIFEIKIANDFKGGLFFSSVFCPFY